MIYVCSDLHGKYSLFKTLLNKINFTSNDEMYVIGDVIDRGEEPIDLLLDILMTPNIHLLLGNHEVMMIEAYQNQKFALWKQNGAAITMAQFERLSSASRDTILRHLTNSLIAIPDLCVGERRFYLSHSGVYPHIHDEPIAYKELNKRDLSLMVWDRSLAEGKTRKQIFLQNARKHYESHTILFGHTPSFMCAFGVTLEEQTPPRIVRNEEENVINLDCGASFGYGVGCLRLDDMREFYCD